MEILRLREQFNKEKSILLSNASSIASNISNASMPSPSRPMKASLPSEGSNKIMFEQMESLRQELKRQQETAMQERKSMLAQHQHELQVLEKRFKQEIYELKTKNSHLDDQIQHLQEDIQHMQQDYSNLQVQKDFLETHKHQLQQESVKLRNDLKSMNQSLQSSYRLDSNATANLMGGGSMGSPSSLHSTGGKNNPFASTASVASNLPNDIDAAMKLHDAKYDAKIRQLTHKIDFFKSQLEIEKKLNDENKQMIQQHEQEIFALQQAQEMKLQDMKHLYEKQMHTLEEKQSIYQEYKQKEYNTLQSQYSILLQQQQDHMHVLTSVKEKEESYIQQIQKLQLLLTNTKTEYEILQKENMKFQEDKKVDISKENQKLQQENIIRRLDNERQYLKNQLTSEITLKNDLQSMITNLQTQLNDVSNQWTKDVNQLKDEKLVLEQQKSSSLSALQQEISILKQEKQSIGGQQQDLKTGYTKIREQLRVLQVEMESKQAECERYKKTLVQLTEELEYKDHKRHEDAAQQEKSYKQYDLLLQEQSKHYQKEMDEKMSLYQSMVKESDQMQETIKAQKEIIDNIDLQIKQHVGVQRMVTVFSNYQWIRKQQMWKKWSQSVLLQNIASQFKGQVEKLMKKAKEDHDKALQKAVQQQKEISLQEKQRALQEQQQRHEVALEGLTDKLTNECETKMEQMQKQFDELKEQLEADHQYDLQQLSTQFQTQFQAFTTESEEERDELIRKMEEKHDLVIAQLHEEFRYATEQRQQEWEKKVQDTIKAKDEEIQQNISHTKEEGRAAMEVALQQKKQQHDKQMQQLRDEAKQQQAKALAQLAEELGKKQEEAMNEKTREFQEQLEKTLQHAEEMLVSLKNELREHEEERIRELRVLWEEEFDEKMIVKHHEFEDQFKIKEMQLQEKLTGELETKMKLEAKKWKQIMKENEKNMDLEKEQLELSLVEKLMKQFTIEKEQLHLSFELEKHQMKGEFEKLKLVFREQLAEEFAEEKVLLKQEEMKKQKDLKEAMEIQFQIQLNEKLSFQANDLEKLHRKVLQQQEDKYTLLQQDYLLQMQLFTEEQKKLQGEVNTKNTEIGALKQEMEEKVHAAESKAAKEMEVQSSQWTVQMNTLKMTMMNNFAEEKNVLQANYARELKYMQDKDARYLEEQQEIWRRHQEDMIEGLKQTNTKETQLIKQEYTEAKSMLDLFQKKVEELEDTIYDAQKTIKGLNREKSFELWKLATKYMTYRQKSGQYIKDLEATHEETLTKERKATELQYQDALFQFNRISNYLEEFTMKIVNITNQYFTNSNQNEDIKRYKQKIIAIEKEIEKLSIEHMKFEEQKDVLLQEIEDLTNQLHEQEESLKKHTTENSSMMLNGRVNVIYARKKRQMDNEIEHLLDTIETKRQVITDYDTRMMDKIAQREEKELLLIEFEQHFVKLLIEQQKHLHDALKNCGNYRERVKDSALILQLPYPPILHRNAETGALEPSLQDIITLLQKRKEKDKRKEEDKHA